MSVPTDSITPEMGLSNFDITPLLPSGVRDALDGMEQLDTFADRWEQCFERGGTLDECTKNLALCALRDVVVDQLFGNASAFAEKLQLEEIFKNYYCDGECYHCCWVPGEGADGAGGGCHTSLDASEGPVLNCNDRYGVGARGVGPALIIGDPTGTGICLGVQQVCNHIAVCNGAATSALDNGAATPPSSDETAFLGASAAVSASAPAGPNMSHPGAAPARAKGFEAAMRRALTEMLAETPASDRRGTYLDFIMGRGAVNWTSLFEQVEPFNGKHLVFRVMDSKGQLREAASYHQAVRVHSVLGLLGAVPNLQDRLAYVESRYWTEDEKREYLDGLDPESELRKSMGAIALEALKRVPIQDWRLLAVPSPGEAPLPYRSFEGFRLGEPPVVNLAQDCLEQDSVTLAIDIRDPEQATSNDAQYALRVDWGDGSIEHQRYDRARAANVFRHTYQVPGKHLAYVTSVNSTGLRGISGIVLESRPSSGNVEPPEGPTPALAVVQLDRVEAYGPAVSSAGKLGLTLELSDNDGSATKVGWSDVKAIPKEGPLFLGDVVGYNESLASMDKITIRASLRDGLLYDSVYLKVPSLTLGIHDGSIGGLATRTVPISAEMVRVYYAGASAPVVPDLLERDVNGDLLLPVDRKNTRLPAGFCGSAACSRVDRIEIPITAALLGHKLPMVRSVPADLPVGSTARWVEDSPNSIVPIPVDDSPSVPGVCRGVIPVSLVAATKPTASFVSHLQITPVDASVSTNVPANLRATATLVDGRVVDVTDKVTWKSSTETVVGVSNGDQKGLLSPALVPGRATVTASLAGVNATTEVTNTNSPRGYRSYRLVVQSVHGNAGRTGIAGLELVVDGRIEPSLMTGTESGSIGPFTASVQCSDGSPATHAFDVSPGTVWSSATGTFATVEPFAATSSPVYMQVDFANPVPVSGIRIHHQRGALASSYKPQFPKSVLVQGSDDGANFQTIAQHTFENWKGEPALVEWTVPVSQ